MIQVGSSFQTPGCIRIASPRIFLSLSLSRQSKLIIVFALWHGVVRVISTTSHELPLCSVVFVILSAPKYNPCEFTQSKDNSQCR